MVVACPVLRVVEHHRLGPRSPGRDFSNDSTCNCTAVLRALAAASPSASPTKPQQHSAGSRPHLSGIRLQATFAPTTASAAATAAAPAAAAASALISSSASCISGSPRLLGLGPDDHGMRRVEPSGRGVFLPGFIPHLVPSRCLAWNVLGECNELLMSNLCPSDGPLSFADLPLQLVRILGNRCCCRRCHCHPNYDAAPAPTVRPLRRRCHCHPNYDAAAAATAAAATAIRTATLPLPSALRTTTAAAATAIRTTMPSELRHHCHCCRRCHCHGCQCHR